MFLNNKADIRINDTIIKRIKTAVNKSQGKYTSISHFIRVAIVKELRRK